MVCCGQHSTSPSPPCRQVTPPAVPTPIREGLWPTFIAAVRDYALLLLDPDGRILSWNRGAELIRGYRADEIIGRHFSCFYPPEDVAAGKPAA